MGRKNGKQLDLLDKALPPRPQSIVEVRAELAEMIKQRDAYRDALIRLLEGLRLSCNMSEELVKPYLDWEIVK